MSAPDDFAPGGPFMLLPLRQQVLSADLGSWSERQVALLVAIIAHENGRTRCCWPSFDRLAILAGLRRADVGILLGNLVAAKWLKDEARPGGGTILRLTYPPYVAGRSVPAEWLRLGRGIVFSGVWAAMSPAARSLFLVLLASSTFGHQADGEWIEMRDGVADDDLCDYDFVSAQSLAPADLRRLSGLTDRNFRKARAWLQDNGLIFPAEHDQLPGIIIPHDPSRHAPAVKERLAAVKEKSAGRPKGGAARSLGAMRRAANRKTSSKKQVTTGN